MNFPSILAAVFFLLASPAVRLHFDSDRAGAPPAFLRFESSLGVSPSTWRAIPDARAITLENVAVQTDSSGSPGQYRFALSTEARDFLDGRVAVSVKREGPSNPCAGGLALRFRDPENFFGVLYDVQKSSIAAISVFKGKRTTLASAIVTSNELIWRTIGVSLSGPKVEVAVSGKRVLEATDPNPAAGASGLLAEGGAVMGFDELMIDPR